jgi:serine protease Do
MKHVFLVVAFAALLANCSSQKPGAQEPWSLSTPVQASTPLPLEQGGADPNIFVRLSQAVVPSVVNISTTKKTKTGKRGSPDDMLRRFFDDFLRRQEDGPPSGRRKPSRPGPGEEKEVSRAFSLGTGFIVEEGLILTNNHVIDGADGIQIQFTEDETEKPTEGEVVGRDAELDLALIKYKATKGLLPLPLGDSDALQVGEYVMAVGNPFGQGHSVTHGIISAKERKAPDFILANYLQTDAPINPGNSGGPLVNLRGEVIGINNAIDQRAQGIGFAIPINLVKRVLPQLKAKGKVTRGYIGVLVNEMTPELAEQLKLSKETKNPLVARVYPGEPAEKAGVKEYDVILEFNGKVIRSASDLVAAVTQVPVGEKGVMKVLRDKKEVALSITVAARPSREEMAGAEGAPEGGPQGKQKSEVETGMALEELDAAQAKEMGLPASTRGLLVSDIDYDGPADRAGVQRGDIIVEVEKKAVRSLSDFNSIVKAKKTYLLRVLRSDGSGRESYAVIVLDLKSS